MMPSRKRSRSTETSAANDRLVTEFDLIEPNGRWRKFRFRGRRERLHNAAFTVAALLASLALWALYLWPLASAINSAITSR